MSVVADMRKNFDGLACRDAQVQRLANDAVSRPRAIMPLPAVKPENDWFMIRVAIVLIWISAFGCSASAQNGTSPAGNSRPTVGVTSGMRTPVETLRSFGASGGVEILRHRGPAGNTCLVVFGFVRPHTVNSNLYDHVIKVTNSCARKNRHAGMLLSDAGLHRGGDTRWRAQRGYSWNFTVNERLSF